MTVLGSTRDGKVVFSHVDEEGYFASGLIRLEDGNIIEMTRYSSNEDSPLLLERYTSITGERVDPYEYDSFTVADPDGTILWGPEFNRFRGFSSDGSLVLSYDPENDQVFVHHTRTGQVVSDSIQGVGPTFLAMGRFVETNRLDNSTEDISGSDIWSTSSGELVHSFADGNYVVPSTGDSDLIATLVDTTAFRGVEVWSAETWMSVGRVEASNVQSVFLSGDGGWAIFDSASDDFDEVKLVFWNIEQQVALATDEFSGIWLDGVTLDLKYAVSGDGYVVALRELDGQAELIVCELVLPDTD